MVLFDQAVDYPAMRGQGSNCRLFVLPHEAAVAVDVGAEDSGELAFHTHLSAHHPAEYLIVSITLLMRAVAQIALMREGR